MGLLSDEYFDSINKIPKIYRSRSIYNCMTNTASKATYCKCDSYLLSTKSFLCWNSATLQLSVAIDPAHEVMDF